MGRPTGPTRDTRTRICERALDLFAEKGYAASTMKDIAAAVGMKDASLYNHFPGKQALFEAVISWQLDRLTATLRGGRALALPDDDAGAYLTCDASELLPVVLASYEPFFTDRQLICLRHILESERHRDARLAEAYRTVFIDRPLELQRAIFARLVDEGLFAPCDIRLAARQFHGPVFLALSEDMGWERASALIERHLAAFLEQHRAEERP